MVQFPFSKFRDSSHTIHWEFVNKLPLKQLEHSKLEDPKQVTQDISHTNGINKLKNYLRCYVYIHHNQYQTIGCW